MQKSQVLKIITVVIGIVILAGGLTMLIRDQKGVKNSGPGQEFTDFQVVQYYLHMPGQDFIIGRKEKSFGKLSSTANTAALSISGSLPVKLANANEIESKVISVTIWLLQPQQVSTKIKTGSGKKDRYGNTVLLTDRIVLVMSGKYQGKIFTRNPQTGEWQGWNSDGAGINGLVEIIRSGGL